MAPKMMKQLNRLKKNDKTLSEKCWPDGDMS